MEKEFSFEGYHSGDRECFCFAVDRETFEGVIGRAPNAWDQSRLHDGLFMIYPDEFFSGLDKKKFKISLRIEESTADSRRCSPLFVGRS